MDTKAAGDAMPPSYDDFEPFCSWQREEGQVTLVVHLPEFKREQMKVHISNHGTLRINGERPIGGTKRSRFTKEIEIPRDCKPNEITAKFSNSGRLCIVMPIKNASKETKHDQPTLVVPQHQDQNQQPLSEGTQGKEAEKPGRQFSTVEQSLTGGRKVVMMGVVVVAVVVALGAFATYKCKSVVLDI